MVERGPEERRYGLYLALGQAGMEMVAPVVLGVLLDRWLATTPWLTVVGVVVGFVGGLGHMIVLAGRLNAEADRKRRERDQGRG
jgi:F0F1-type ATP synthase assembly protein I